MGRFLLVILTGVLALSGCTGALVSPAGAELAPQEDVVNDVLRDEGFTFALYMPVSFRITPEPVDLTARSVSDPASPVFLQVTDQDDNVLLSGVSWDREAISGEILVLSATTAITISLSGPGYETRYVDVETPARYETIDRILLLKTDNGDVGSKDDRDGDGVPDVYDAYPDDIRYAFSRDIPASGYLTVAYEDNYPNLGDGDYNDFVAAYRITEYRTSTNALAAVEGDVHAMARGAGFDHEFGIVVQIPGCSGTASVTLFDSQGAQVAETAEAVTDLARFVIFPDTKSAFDRSGDTVHMDNVRTWEPETEGYTATFSLELDDLESSPKIVDLLAPFDPYLLVTRPDFEDPDVMVHYDVHLIGQQPLPGSQNPEGLDGTLDADGYPRALLVPNDWLWPQDRVHIESVYPSFAEWRDSAGELATDWYLFPEGGGVYPR